MKQLSTILLSCNFIWSEIFRSNLNDLYILWIFFKWSYRSWDYRWIYEFTLLFTDMSSSFGRIISLFSRTNSFIYHFFKQQTIDDNPLHIFFDEKMNDEAIFLTYLTKYNRKIYILIKSKKNSRPRFFFLSKNNKRWSCFSCKILEFPKSYIYI